jgi:hypothetical protein
VNENVRTALVVDGAAIGTLVASYATRASAYVGPELCLVKRLFHVRCAGCGLMRSFASLWDGNVAESFRMHTMGPLLFAALALAPLVDLVALALRRGPVVPRLLGLRPFQALVAVGVVAALVLPFQEMR